MTDNFFDTLKHEGVEGVLNKYSTVEDELAHLRSNVNDLATIGIEQREEIARLNKTIQAMANYIDWAHVPESLLGVLKLRDPSRVIDYKSIEYLEGKDSEAYVDSALVKEAPK